jgi:1,4-dihydroxy-2-naphthoyl-CoA hydrolase
MSSPAFRRTVEVRMHEVDAAGVLFFAHLFRYAHDAYEAFMAHLGFSLPAVVRDRAWRLPLVHAEADYRRPIRHGERLTVTVGVADLGESAYTVRYRFDDAKGEARATARTVHVHLEADGSRSAPLPPELREALASISGPAAPEGG